MPEEAGSSPDLLIEIGLGGIEELEAQLGQVTERLRRVVGEAEKTQDIDVLGGAKSGDQFLKALNEIQGSVAKTRGAIGTMGDGASASQAQLKQLASGITQLERGLRQLEQARKFDVGQAFGRAGANAADFYGVLEQLISGLGRLGTSGSAVGKSVEKLLNSKGAQGLAQAIGEQNAQLLAQAEQLGRNAKGVTELAQQFQRLSEIQGRLQIGRSDPSGLRALTEQQQSFRTLLDGRTRIAKEIKQNYESLRKTIPTIGVPIVMNLDQPPKPAGPARRPAWVDVIHSEEAKPVATRRRRANAVVPEPVVEQQPATPAKTLTVHEVRVDATQATTELKALQVAMKALPPSRTVTIGLANLSQAVVGVEQIRIGLAKLYQPHTLDVRLDIRRVLSDLSQVKRAITAVAAEPRMLPAAREDRAPATPAEVTEVVDTASQARLEAERELQLAMGKTARISEEVRELQVARTGAVLEERLAVLQLNNALDQVAKTRARLAGTAEGKAFELGLRGRGPQAIGLIAPTLPPDQVSDSSKLTELQKRLKAAAEAAAELRGEISATVRLISMIRKPELDFQQVDDKDKAAWQTARTRLDKAEEAGTRGLLFSGDEAQRRIRGIADEAVRTASALEKLSLLPSSRPWAPGGKGSESARFTSRETESLLSLPGYVPSLRKSRFEVGGGGSWRDRAPGGPLERRVAETEWIEPRALQGRTFRPHLAIDQGHEPFYRRGMAEEFGAAARRKILADQGRQRFEGFVREDLRGLPSTAAIESAVAGLKQAGAIVRSLGSQMEVFRKPFVLRVEVQELQSALQLVGQVRSAMASLASSQRLLAGLPGPALLPAGERGGAMVRPQSRAASLPARSDRILPVQVEEVRADMARRALPPAGGTSRQPGGALVLRSLFGENPEGDLARAKGLVGEFRKVSEEIAAVGKGKAGGSLSTALLGENWEQEVGRATQAINTVREMVASIADQGWQQGRSKGKDENGEDKGFDTSFYGRIQGALNAVTQDFSKLDGAIDQNTQEWSEWLARMEQLAQLLKSNYGMSKAGAAQIIAEDPANFPTKATNNGWSAVDGIIQTEAGLGLERARLKDALRNIDLRPEYIAQNPQALEAAKAAISELADIEERITQQQKAQVQLQEQFAKAATQSAAAAARIGITDLAPARAARLEQLRANQPERQQEVAYATRYRSKRDAADQLIQERIVQKEVRDQRQASLDQLFGGVDNQKVIEAAEGLKKIKFYRDQLEQAGYGNLLGLSDKELTQLREAVALIEKTRRFTAGDLQETDPARFRRLEAIRQAPEDTGRYRRQQGIYDRLFAPADEADARLLAARDRRAELAAYGRSGGDVRRAVNDARYDQRQQAYNDLFAPKGRLDAISKGLQDYGGPIVSKGMEIGRGLAEGIKSGFGKMVWFNRIFEGLVAGAGQAIRKTAQVIGSGAGEIAKFGAIMSVPFGLVAVELIALGKAAGESGVNIFALIRSFASGETQMAALGGLLEAVKAKLIALGTASSSAAFGGVAAAASAAVASINPLVLAMGGLAATAGVLGVALSVLPERIGGWANPFKAAVNEVRAAMSELRAMGRGLDAFNLSPNQMGKAREAMRAAVDNTPLSSPKYLRRSARLYTAETLGDLQRTRADLLAAQQATEAGRLDATDTGALGLAGTSLAALRNELKVQQGKLANSDALKGGDVATQAAERVAQLEQEITEQEKAQLDLINKARQARVEGATQELRTVKKIRSELEELRSQRSKTLPGDADNVSLYGQIAKAETDALRSEAEQLRVDTDLLKTSAEALALAEAKLIKEQAITAQKEAQASIDRQALRNQDAPFNEAGNRPSQVTGLYAQLAGDRTAAPILAKQVGSISPTDFADMSSEMLDLTYRELQRVQSMAAGRIDRRAQAQADAQIAASEIRASIAATGMAPEGSQFGAMPGPRLVERRSAFATPEGETMRQRALQIAADEAQRNYQAELRASGQSVAVEMGSPTQLEGLRRSLQSKLSDMAPDNPQFGRIEMQIEAVTERLKVFKKEVASVKAAKVTAEIDETSLAAASQRIANLRKEIAEMPAVEVAVRGQSKAIDLVNAQRKELQDRVDRTIPGTEDNRRAVAEQTAFERGNAVVDPSGRLRTADETQAALREAITQDLLDQKKALEDTTLPGSLERAQGEISLGRTRMARLGEAPLPLLVDDLNARAGEMRMKTPEGSPQRIEGEMQILREREQLLGVTNETLQQGLALKSAYLQKTTAEGSPDRLRGEIGLLEDRNRLFGTSAQNLQALIALKEKLLQLTTVEGSAERLAGETQLASERLRMAAPTPQSRLDVLRAKMREVEGTTLPDSPERAEGRARIIGEVNQALGVNKKDLENALDSQLDSLRRNTLPDTAARLEGELQNVRQRIHTLGRTPALEEVERRLQSDVVGISNPPGSLGRIRADQTALRDRMAREGVSRELLGQQFELQRQELEQTTLPDTPARRDGELQQIQQKIKLLGASNELLEAERKLTEEVAQEKAKEVAPEGSLRAEEAILRDLREKLSLIRQGTAAYREQVMEIAKAEAMSARNQVVSTTQRNQAFLAESGIVLPGGPAMPGMPSVAAAEAVASRSGILSTLGSRLLLRERVDDEAGAIFPGAKGGEPWWKDARNEAGQQIDFPSWIEKVRRGGGWKVEKISDHRQAAEMQRMLQDIDIDVPVEKILKQGAPDWDQIEKAYGFPSGLPGFPHSASTPNYAKARASNGMRHDSSLFHLIAQDFYAEGDEPAAQPSTSAPPKSSGDLSRRARLSLSEQIAAQAQRRVDAIARINSEIERARSEGRPTFDLEERRSTIHKQQNALATLTLGGYGEDSKVTRLERFHEPFYIQSRRHAQEAVDLRGAGRTQEADKLEEQALRERQVADAIQRRVEALRTKTSTEATPAEAKLKDVVADVVTDLVTDISRKVQQAGAAASDAAAKVSATAGGATKPWWQDIIDTRTGEAYDPTPILEVFKKAGGIPTDVIRNNLFAKDTGEYLRGRGLDISDEEVFEKGSPAVSSITDGAGIRNLERYAIGSTGQSLYDAINAEFYRGTSIPRAPRTMVNGATDQAEVKPDSEWKFAGSRFSAIQPLERPNAPFYDLADWFEGVRKTGVELHHVSDAQTAREMAYHYSSRGLDISAEDILRRGGLVDTSSVQFPAGIGGDDLLQADNYLFDRQNAGKSGGFKPTLARIVQQAFIEGEIPTVQEAAARAAAQPSAPAQPKPRLTVEEQLQRQSARRDQEYERNREAIKQARAAGEEETAKSLVTRNSRLFEQLQHTPVNPDGSMQADMGTPDARLAFSEERISGRLQHEKDPEKAARLQRQVDVIRRRRSGLQETPEALKEQIRREESEQAQSRLQQQIRKEEEVQSLQHQVRAEQKQDLQQQVAREIEAEQKKVQSAPAGQAEASRLEKTATQGVGEILDAVGQKVHQAESQVAKEVRSASAAGGDQPLGKTYGPKDVEGWPKLVNSIFSEYQEEFAKIGITSKDQIKSIPFEFANPKKHSGLVERVGGNEREPQAVLNRYADAFQQESTATPEDFFKATGKKSNAAIDLAKSSATDAPLPPNVRPAVYVQPGEAQAAELAQVAREETKALVTEVKEKLVAAERAASDAVSATPIPSMSGSDGGAGGSAGKPPRRSSGSSGSVPPAPPAPPSGSSGGDLPPEESEYERRLRGAAHKTMPMLTGVKQALEQERDALLAIKSVNGSLIQQEKERLQVIEQQLNKVNAEIESRNRGPGLMANLRNRKLWGEAAGLSAISGGGLFSSLGSVAGTMVGASMGNPFFGGIAGQQIGMLLDTQMSSSGAKALELDRELKRLYAVSGAKDRERPGLESMVRTLAIETGQAAPQVATFATDLARAGFRPNEIRGVLGPSLKLAESTGEDPKQSAEAVRQVMKVYGLQADEAVSVADKLQTAANMTAVSVLEIAESLKQLGPTAVQSNQSLETSLALIGAMGDTGIRGSSAGTKIKELFQRMKTASAANIVDDEELLKSVRGQKQLATAAKAINLDIRTPTGELKDYVEVIDILDKKLKGYTKPEQDLITLALFGRQGQVAWNALRSQLESIPGLLEAIKNSGGSVDLIFNETQSTARTEASFTEAWDQFTGRGAKMWGDFLAPGKRYLTQMMKGQAERERDLQENMALDVQPLQAEGWAPTPGSASSGTSPGGRAYVASMYGLPGTVRQASDYVVVPKQIKDDLGSLVQAGEKVGIDPRALKAGYFQTYSKLSAKPEYNKDRDSFEEARLQAEALHQTREQFYVDATRSQKGFLSRRASKIARYARSNFGSEALEDELNRLSETTRGKADKDRQQILENRRREGNVSERIQKDIAVRLGKTDLTGAPAGSKAHEEEAGKRTDMIAALRIQATEKDMPILEMLKRLKSGKLKAEDLRLTDKDGNIKKQFEYLQLSKEEAQRYDELLKGLGLSPQVLGSLLELVSASDKGARAAQQQQDSAEKAADALEKEKEKAQALKEALEELSSVKVDLEIKGLEDKGQYVDALRNVVTAQAELVKSQFSLKLAPFNYRASQLSEEENKAKENAPESAQKAIERQFARERKQLEEQIKEVKSQALKAELSALEKVAALEKERLAINIKMAELKEKQDTAQAELELSKARLEMEKSDSEDGKNLSDTEKTRLERYQAILDFTKQREGSAAKLGKLEMEAQDLQTQARRNELSAQHIELTGKDILTGKDVKLPPSAVKPQTTSARSTGLDAAANSARSAAPRTPTAEEVYWALELTPPAKGSKPRPWGAPDSFDIQPSYGWPGEEMDAKAREAARLQMEAQSQLDQITATRSLLQQERFSNSLARPAADQGALDEAYMQRQRQLDEQEARIRATQEGRARLEQERAAATERDRQQTELQSAESYRRDPSMWEDRRQIPGALALSQQMGGDKGIVQVTDQSSEQQVGLLSSIDAKIAQLASTPQPVTVDIRYNADTGQAISSIAGARS